MKFIEPDFKDKVLEKTNFNEIVDVYIDYSKPQKAVLKGKCPLCGSGKFRFDPKKQLATCFECSESANNPIGFMMKFKGMEYVEAVLYLAKQAGVLIPDEKVKAKVNKPAKHSATGQSFKNRQLELSGLTTKDVKATQYIPEENKQKEIDVFTSETLSANNNLIEGDDMVIKYLDLDGKPVKYTVKNEKIEREFYRIRWQFPESHLDLSGKPKKYQSPFGSNIKLYIPETIRRIYRENHTTKRLFFTEGEKKAEKMCKHGYPAFGMPGINALASKNSAFPDSVVRFLEQCAVKEIFFVLDSDFRDLSNTLTEDKDIAERARNFFYAVKNFRDWFRTLANRNLMPEIYFIGGKGSQKGVDDQLTNTLAGNEAQYGEELERLINGIVDSETESELFELHKISQMSDTKIADIWKLNDKEAFCKMHTEILQEMPCFTFGKNKWKFNDDGDIELSQPIYDDEKFVVSKEIRRRGGITDCELKFDYVNMINFLKNRGFYRLKMNDGIIRFCRVENNIIRNIEPIHVRDFIMDFSNEIFDHETNDKLISGGAQYFGAEKLSYLPYFEPNKIVPEKYSEYLFFDSKAWKITAEKIEVKNISEISENIFIDSINPNPIERSEKLITVEKVGDNFKIELSKTAQENDFINYLCATSLLNWTKYYDESRKKTSNEMDIEDYHDFTLHLLSKITAMGYMLHKYRDKNSEKAIIAMDARISEVGEANGRSGKSIMGHAISHVRNQTYIDAKRSGMEQDRFLWQEVTKQTENIFIDDVRVNFDFDMIYNVVMGILTIEPKGEKKYTLRDHEVPKIYLTTNHTINGSTGSYKDRQFKIAFSDFFDEDFKPFEFFGRCLFTEWDTEQWTVFYNFMAECIQIYFIAAKNGWGLSQSGLIAAPCISIERRQYRQEMTENFFQWLCETLGIDENNYEICNDKLNHKLVRTELQEQYLQKFPREKNYYSPNKWWKKLVLFCKYFGFRLNPVQSTNQDKPEHDKTGGTEYITIANKFFDC